MATKANRDIKVSQATIDKIKKQGMTASLKAASSNNSPEYREALRRMYGDARVAKATASTKPSSSGRYVGSMFVPDKPATSSTASTKYSPAPMSAAAKAKAAAAGAARKVKKSSDIPLTPTQRAQQQAYQDQYGYKATPKTKTPAQIAAAKKKAAEAAKRRAAAAAGRASSARTH
jgi:hypothetical protein